LEQAYELDVDKAEKLSKSVKSGIVTVDNVVISNQRVQFGGIKNISFGRELSRYGMLELSMSSPSDSTTSQFISGM
jgi:acyl-CoA reductase-like NAD-dependent aldehyde dehydrogenase